MNPPCSFTAGDTLLPLFCGFLLAGVFLLTLRLTIHRALGQPGKADDGKPKRAPEGVVPLPPRAADDGKEIAAAGPRDIGAGTVPGEAQAAPRPWLFLLGFVFRLAAIVAGMMLVCGSSAGSWLWCLAGFTLGKAILMRPLSLEVGHARI